MNAFTRPVTSSQPAPITDPEPEPESFDLPVLLTASAAESLLPYMDVAGLPHFDKGPCWTVQVEAALKADDCFDLAIVLCAEASQLAASASLVQRLNEPRIATVMLVPAALERFLITTAAFLTIVAPDDLSGGINVLADTLLAPVQQDGLVCCDLADILGVVNDGTRAQLFSVEAPSAAEAVRALAERLAPLATGEGYGVVATLYMNATSRMRDWWPLRNVVNATVRQDAMVMASAPVSKSSISIAAAMVMTVPSSRYFRNPIHPDRVA